MRPIRAALLHNWAPPPLPGAVSASLSEALADSINKLAFFEYICPMASRSVSFVVVQTLVHSSTKRVIKRLGSMSVGEAEPVSLRKVGMSIFTRSNWYVRRSTFFIVT